MKRVVFYLISMGLLYGTFEILSFAGLAFIENAKFTTYDPILTSSVSDYDQRLLTKVINGETRYIEYSPTLGWTIKPSSNTSLYRSNAQGIRADQEYTPVPADGIVRIAAFGDSFTHGDDVGNGDTWEYQMEKTNPILEVLNFGVLAFGVDQAFLRYQEEGIQYKPKIVLIGIMTTNVNRHVNVFRPFTAPRMGLPFAKPRFMIVDDTLTLIENPIRSLAGYRDLLDRPESELARLGKHDYYYHIRYRRMAMDILPSVRVFNLTAYEIRKTFSNHTYKNDYFNYIDGEYFNSESEAFVITTRILDEFVKAVTSNKSVPLILLFPRRYDVGRYRRAGTKMYAALRTYLENVGHDFVDLMEAFEGRGKNFSIDDLFVFGHYSPLGNKIVAEHITRALKERALIP